MKRLLPWHLGANRKGKEILLVNCPHWDSTGTSDGIAWPCRRGWIGPGTAGDASLGSPLLRRFQASPPEISFCPRACDGPGEALFGLMDQGQPTGPCQPCPATLGPRTSPTLVKLPPAQVSHLAPAAQPGPAGLRGLTQEVTCKSASVLRARGKGPVTGKDAEPGGTFQSSLGSSCPRMPPPREQAPHLLVHLSAWNVARHGTATSSTC